MQFEGYKCDPNGEYVRRWLPELARLPTEWIHHPWNAPEYVLQAAGVELGSNYPLPLVGIDAAEARLEEALSQMWQLEAASRAAMENGIEEGLGDSETGPIAFPQDMQVEITQHHPIRNNPTTAGIRRYEDQMVPSITSSILRIEDEETSTDVRNSAETSRAEVPITVNMIEEARNEAFSQPHTTARNNNMLPQFNFLVGRRNSEDSTAESSSIGGRRERDGGVVPVWSPSSSNFSDQFVSEDNGLGATSSYLQRHPESHQIINWRRLSQTG